MYDLQTAVEEWIARLPDDDFRALCARVRPPFPTTGKIGESTESSSAGGPSAEVSR